MSAGHISSSARRLRGSDMGERRKVRQEDAEPGPSAAPDMSREPAPASPTGPLLAASLGLVGMALLPLAGGGYSGAGYIVALVMLPLCAALAWPLLRERPVIVQVILLLYLL